MFGGFKTLKYQTSDMPGGGKSNKLKLTENGIETTSNKNSKNKNKFCENASTFEKRK